MTHWRTLVSNSETLSASDLGDHTPTVTISKVEGVAFTDDAGKPDKKALIHFEGKDKGLAANYINCSLIEALFGAEVEGWVGHAITIKADTVEIRGTLYGKPCIRVAGSPELAEAMDVEIRLPRRKPIRRKLVPTKTANTAQKQAKSASPDPNGIPELDSGLERAKAFFEDGAQ